MDHFPTDKIGLLLFGNLVAFVVALLAIRFFINFLTRNGFKVFGYYRIIVGSIILLLMAMGVNLSIV
jgi:undecaprenyl-diphosphatase